MLLQRQDRRVRECWFKVQAASVAGQLYFRVLPSRTAIAGRTSRDFPGFLSESLKIPSK